MATKYARAAGGNWSADATWSLSSGGAADTVAPTAADDVILDGASGNVTININSVARSLDCNGYTGTLTHNASTNLSIGDATTGTGNRAIRMSAGMTYSLGVSASITLVSTSVTQQTVTTAGKSMPYMQFGSTGAPSYQLTDSLTVTGTTLVLQMGTLDTNSQTISAQIFNTSNSNPRTLTLGSSSITLSSTSTAAWNATTVTNLTVTANTATVTFTGTSAGLVSGTINWNGLSVVMNGAGSQGFGGGTVAPTFANFTRTGTASTTCSLAVSLSAAPIVTGTLTLTGNNASNYRLAVFAGALGTARTITAAAVSLTNVDFRDITAAGASIPWTGTSLGNALGNTNITFDTPTTRYGVAAGNWSSTSMWSTSSGGAGGASVPLPQDNVVLDASSGAGTYTNDMPRMCADLNCTGFTRTLQASASGTEIYGSMTLGTGMTWSIASGITLLGRSSHTITSAGKTMTTALLTINCVTGTYTLADAWTNTYAQTSVFTLTSGTFSDGGFSVNTTEGRPNWAGGTANLTGTWTVCNTTTGTCWNHTGGTMNASTNTIVFPSTTTNRAFVGGGKPYGTLTYNVAGSTGSLTITGSNTFNTINFSDVTNARTLTLASGTTTIITNSFNVNGTAGKLMTLNSSTPASAAILSKPTGLVSCDYLSIQDSTATGGARYFAGTHSTNVSGNTGWNFIAPTYNTSSTGIIA